MTEEKLTQEQTDEKMIDEAFQELLDQYLKSKHRKKVEIITKAFNFARQAHKGVRRRSGEPYILHPIAVARIACCEIGLGSTSICAALLHDVLVVVGFYAVSRIAVGSTFIACMLTILVRSWSMTHSSEGSSWA